MGVPVKVPAVGESITEVTIASWTKNDGDFVEMDEIIAELESDKATFELTAPQAGVLKIVKQAGEVVPIGELLCELEGGEKSKSSADSKTKDSKPAESSGSDKPAKTGEVKEMKVPTVGESISEVVISTWLKKDGDIVRLDEIIAEVESDKATFELPAEATGMLSIVATEGSTLPIGGLICKIEVMEGVGDGSSSPETSSQSKEESGSGDKNYAAGHPSPAASKILDEKGISADQVKGSGVGGRINKEDAVNASSSSKGSTSSTPSTSSKASAPGARNQRREKMTSLRKTISRRLVSVKNDTAMLTTFNEVNMKPIMDLRSKYKEQFKEKYGVGLGFMSFFTKAVCIALNEWPAVNAQIDGEEIVYSDYCDVSIAVSTPKGLVVPVIRNAESMSFQEIEAEVVRLATRGRDGKLSIDEMTGGTFSITNGGIFGSMMSTPILNPPQSAILGMHNIVQRPMAVDGQVVILPMMYLALSYDHRVVDGRESVSFLVRVKELLEDPGRLLLSV